MVEKTRRRKDNQRQGYWHDRLNVMNMKKATIIAAVIGAVAIIIAALLPLFWGHQAGTSNGDTVIAGIVVDQDTNEAIGQVTITVAGRTDEYLTEDSGNFRMVLHGEVPNRLRIHVRKPGFRPLDTSVEPPAENLVWQLHKQ